jgi:hypothetical protein
MARFSEATANLNYPFKRSILKSKLEPRMMSSSKQLFGVLNGTRWQDGTDARDAALI